MALCINTSCLTCYVIVLKCKQLEANITNDLDKSAYIYDVT